MKKSSSDFMKPIVLESMKSLNSIWRDCEILAATNAKEAVAEKLESLYADAKVELLLNEPALCL